MKQRIIRQRPPQRPRRVPKNRYEMPLPATPGYVVNLMLRAYMLRKEAQNLEALADAQIACMKAMNPQRPATTMKWTAQTYKESSMSFSFAVLGLTKKEAQQAFNDAMHEQQNFNNCPIRDSVEKATQALLETMPETPPAGMRYSISCNGHVEMEPGAAILTRVGNASVSVSCNVPIPA